MGECAARTSRKNCLLLNMRLGWDNLLTLDKCDMCWKLGGPKSPRANALLDLEAQRIVEWAKQPENAVRLPREVLVPLTVKHLSPEDAKRLSPVMDVGLAKDSVWPQVRETWEKAASFFATVLSGVWSPPIPEEVYQKRMESCSTCPGRMEGGGHSYCGVCGCGARKLARLDGKLRYPHLKCPLGREGFYEGDAE